MSKIYIAVSVAQFETTNSTSMPHRLSASGVRVAADWHNRVAGFGL